MCGICGWVAPAGDAPSEGTEPMARCLTHRGPDGSGEAREDGGGLVAWMGHRRLRIIDLTSKADQPMRSTDGRLMLTYNGEIYNFRELRTELKQRGHSFQSSGDTEVVLRAYEEWGAAFVKRLDGMFALAIWDGRLGRLLMARDRSGKKPLFYSSDRTRIAFGSEIKSVLMCPWVERTPDLGRVAEFLSFGSVPWPSTFYEGIHEVPPASYVTFDADGLSAVHRYWDAAPSDTDLRPRGDVLAEIRNLVKEAVRRRLVADVPLGALLSGGVDSSLVVALMTELGDEPVHTFSIGFRGEESYDERPYAARVAKHFGTRHTEFTVDMDAVGLLDRLVWHHDGPFGDSSAIPTYAVCQLAREHVTVALNGDGGDEVFAGYDRFKAAALSFQLPRPVAGAGRSLAARLPVNHGYFSVRRRAERFFELADAPVEDRYQSWTAVANPELLAELVIDDGDGALASMERAYDRSRALPPLDRILYANFTTYLPSDLAVKMDRMSMANSLETRSPFLDTALVEYVARLPARRRIGLRRVKPVLRAALRDRLPDDIWNRRKHGFGAPVGAWLRGELREMFADEVLGADSRSGALLRMDTVHRLYSEHQAGEREHGFRLWTLLTLERWLRQMDEPPSVEPPAATPLRDASGTQVG